MRPIGYMFKRVATRPDWINAPHVADIYSLSGHISEDFTDYINYWNTTVFGCSTRQGRSALLRASMTSLMG